VALGETIQRVIASWTERRVRRPTGRSASGVAQHHRALTTTCDAGAPDRRAEDKTEAARGGTSSRREPGQARGATAEMTAATVRPSADEVPRCIRCGQPLIREVASVPGSRHERWFECFYCHRTFCIRVVALPPIPGMDNQE